MRRYLIALALALTLAAPASSEAANETDLMRQIDGWATGQTPPKLLSAVACNAAAAARTWTMTADRGKGFALGAFQVDFTRNAATLLTMTATGSLNGSTFGSIPVCDDTTDGVCGLTGSTVFTRDVSGGSENFIFRVDYLGATDIKLVVACTGGGASDTFDLYGRFSVQ